MYQLPYEEIERKDINVGDEVYTLTYPGFGWSQRFRYPQVLKHKIAKITPKRTKITTEKGVEFDPKCKFYKLNDALIEHVKIANAFHNCYMYAQNPQAGMLAHMSDETILKLNEHVEEIKKLIANDEQYAKYRESRR